MFLERRFNLTDYWHDCVNYMRHVFLFHSKAVTAGKSWPIAWDRGKPAQAPEASPATLIDGEMLPESD
jgi:hypothetical protein